MVVVCGYVFYVCVRGWGRVLSVVEAFQYGIGPLMVEGFSVFEVV